MKRLLAVVVGLALALVGAVATAAWLSSGSASAAVVATSVSRANAPAAVRGSGVVDLSWTASTLADGSPVGGYRVVRHNGSVTTTVCTVAAPTVSCTDSAPLAGAVTYGVTATIGTYWRGAESPLTGFTYDGTPPTTTANVTPTPNADGWNKGPSSDVTVTLTATDTATSPSSGVDHLSYTIDSSSAVAVNAATTSFTVSGAGTHTVTYFAVDHAGNTESTKSLTVKIDPNAPVTTLSSPSPFPAWSKDPVTLQFSSTDSGTSGLASITAGGTTTTLSGAPADATTSRTISAEGTTQVDYFATDVAGNTEGTKSVTVKIDKTAPTSTISPATSSSWIKQATQAVTITGADTAGATGGNSGVASIVYQVDNQSVVTTTSPATFSVGQGDHTISYHAVDVAGNVQQDQAATIRVDNVAPSVTNLKPATSASGAWASINCSGNDRVCADVSDATSGVSAVTFQLTGTSGSNNGKCWSGSTFSAGPCTPQPMSLLSGNQYGSGATLTSALIGSGTYTLVVTAVDGAGNSTSGTSSFTVTSGDTTKPVISSVVPSTSGKWSAIACNVVGTAGKICVTATDNVGVTQVTMTLKKDSNSHYWNGQPLSDFTSTSSIDIAMTPQSGNVWTTTNSLTRDASQGANKFTDGSYTLTITAYDAAGNVATTTQSFTLNGS